MSQIIPVAKLQSRIFREFRRAVRRGGSKTGSGLFPKVVRGFSHPLVSVVVIALMAILAGAGGPTAIAQWAMLKQEFLLKTLDLPNGIPRKDVFRRVLAALKPGAFQACFSN